MKLVKGAGSPTEGACWMSAIAWYAGEKDWNDSPKCVSPMIRQLCIFVNDKLPSNAERERVISPIMFDVVGTRTDDSAITLERKKLVVSFAARCAKRVVQFAGEAKPQSEAAIKAAIAWVESPCKETATAAAYAAYSAAYAAYSAANAATNAYYLKNEIINDCVETILAMAKIGAREEVVKVRELSEIPAFKEIDAS